jgi:hypothetical protein
VESFIRIAPGIEEGEPSLCGGAPRAVIPGGILKCRDPACTHPKTCHNFVKNQFRPQFRAQIVAGVETHRYSPFLGPGGHFWQNYEDNQVQKNRHRIYPTILKTAKSTFVPGFSILLESTVDLENFPSFPSWQILKLDWKRHELQYLGGCQWGGAGWKVIALFAWAPRPNSGFYIVNSAARLINSENLHIKTHDAFWIYARTI